LKKLVGGLREKEEKGPRVNGGEGFGNAFDGWEGGEAVSRIEERGIRGLVCQ